MSVINQALKDLHKRQSQGARVRSVYQPPRGRRTAVWFGIGAGVLIGIVISYLMLTFAFVGATPEIEQVEQAEPALDVVDVESSVFEGETQDYAEPPLESVQKASVESTPQEIALPQVGLRTPTTSEQPAPTQTTPQETTLHAQIEAEAPDESHGSMRVERVERSASELAEQRLAQAILAIDNGQGRRGETLLQEALILRPHYTDARQRLAAYYYGRGFSNEALRVLQDGLALEPNHVALLVLKARIYEETSRPEQALAALNRVQVQLPEQSDLLVLRAALANELGHFGAAAEDYRALLANNSAQGIWWLGLGYAEEQQGATAEAEMAYQQALTDSNLDRESRGFVRSRLEALNSW